MLSRDPMHKTGATTAILLSLTLSTACSGLPDAAPSAAGVGPLTADQQLDLVKKLEGT